MHLMHLKTADTGETAGAMRHRSCMPARQKLWCMYIPSARVLPTANIASLISLQCSTVLEALVSLFWIENTS